MIAVSAMGATARRRSPFRGSHCASPGRRVDDIDYTVVRISPILEDLTPSGRECAHCSGPVSSTDRTGQRPDGAPQSSRPADVSVPAGRGESDGCTGRVRPGATRITVDPPHNWIGSMIQGVAITSDP